MDKLWHQPREVPQPGRRIEVNWNPIFASYPVTSKYSRYGRVTNHQTNNVFKSVFRPDNYDAINQEDGYYIGAGYNAVTGWRYIDGPIPVQSLISDKEGAKKMFVATTVKAKGGYRAQVTFNQVVVWEADTVYADDDNYKAGDYEDNTPGVGTSGQEKAQKAAAKAVDQAVEALFAKVKV